MRPRSHVSRHIRKEDTGEKEWYQIPVVKCDHEGCNTMRRLLPDFMAPHKHYEEKAISDVLEEVITEESPVDYPSIQTMRRWIAWLALNADRIECILRSVGYRLLGFGEELLFYEGSLLEQLRTKTDQWLKIILRFVYNSGYSLIPLR